MLDEQRELVREFVNLSRRTATDRFEPSYAVLII
jgi:hypothetical protein